MIRIRILLMLFGLLIFGLPAQAQVTSLTLSGDPSDYIVGNQFLFFTPADGSFIAEQNFDQGASFSFNTPTFSHFWHLDFAAANSQFLTVGTYTGAARFPFQASSQPGLSLYGDGRGCNTLTGSFQVLEVSYGAGTINSFDAIFEQHCEGGVPAARGEIRYNAHPVVSVTAPSQLTAPENQNINFTVSATDAQFRHVVLTATGVPAGATFVDNGNNTGTFNWTPTSSQAGNYLLTFQGDNLSGHIGATYTQINVIAPPPPNDDFNNATVIQSIPFTTSEDVSVATTAPDDPLSCFGANQTVWFAFTPPTNIRLEANTFGSNYDTILSVYTGTRGALTLIACNDDSNNTVQSRVRFDAVAGTTYYFMVSSLFPVSSANLVFNLLQGPPPLSIAPSVSQFGSVDPTTGTATLTGSVTCSQPVFVTLSGQLKQMHAGTPISGFFSTFIPCDGTTPWSFTVQTVPSLFHGRSVALFTGGKATVFASAVAFDPDTGEFIQRNLTVTITLRGKN